MDDVLDHPRDGARWADGQAGTSMFVLHVMSSSCPCHLHCYGRPASAILSGLFEGNFCIIKHEYACGS